MPTFRSGAGRLLRHHPHTQCLHSWHLFSFCSPHNNTIGGADLSQQAVRGVSWNIEIHRLCLSRIRCSWVFTGLPCANLVRLIFAVVA